MKKFYSNNCIKVNNIEYLSKFIITVNDDKLFTLFEYDKNKGEYRKIRQTFNYYTFIDTLKLHNIKKYFSEKEFI